LSKLGGFAKDGSLEPTAPAKGGNLGGSLLEEGT